MSNISLMAIASFAFLFGGVVVTLIGLAMKDPWLVGGGIQSSIVGVGFAILSLRELLS